jgi:urea carboxylase
LLAETTQIPEGTEPIEAPLGGNVWRVHVRPGDVIQKGSVIAVIEAMKTECEVPSPHTGIVRAVYIRERQHVRPGTPIIALELSTRAPSGGN